MDELERLRRENGELRLQVARLAGEISRLVGELARLNERVGELLAVAQRKQRKPPVPPASLAPAPAVEGEARRAFEARPKAPLGDMTPAAFKRTRV